MTNSIIDYIANYVNEKLIDDEIDFKFKVDTGNFSTHSITMRITSNRDDYMFLNKNNHSNIQISFIIKDVDQVAIFNIQDTIKDILYDIRFKNLEQYTIYQVKNTHTNITSLMEDDTYIGTIDFYIEYIDKQIH